MYQDTQLLNSIYKSAQTGVQSIDSLLSKVHDEPLKAELSRQRNDYLYYAQRAKEQLQKSHKKPKESYTSKITIPLGITMNTIMDQSSSHIAEMMINGNTMGIIEMTKELQSQTQEGTAQSLGKSLLACEQKNIKKLKPFLKKEEE